MDLSRVVWRKSTRSQGNGQCVDVATFSDAVALRDSKNTEGPVLIFTPGGWAAFIQGAKDGTFNLT